MELEATILERLQELRRWQVEQQERLLKQQQEQRDLLSFEQDRMYQALGLSVQNIILDDSQAEQMENMPKSELPNDCPKIVISETSSHEECQPLGELEESIHSQEVIVDEKLQNQSTIELSIPPLQLTTNRYLNFKSSVEGFSPRSEIPTEHESLVITTSFDRTPEKIHRRIAELSMEGVEPLPFDKPSKTIIALDDLPVPSPKKDFTTLLEERLRDCEAIAEAPKEKNGKMIIKRPFLKKGEGLARFKPNPAGNASTRRGRPRSVSLSASMRLTATSGSKNNASKLKETPKSSRTCGTYGRTSAVPSTAQSKLSLKHIPPPKNKGRSKSMSAVTNKSSLNKVRAKPPVDLNISSDIETKNRRDLEEMRIFELLEEKAENSSFCSNSSTVLALFRQSTPLKSRSTAINNNRDNKQRGNVETLARRETSDTSLEEIVRSTKSNMTVPGSPITKIRETVIQKDYVISKWDSGPMTDENINTTNSNRVANCALAAGTYKSTKHTTIQFNNNNNNGNENKTAINSNEVNGCRRNVNFQDDENYHDTIDNEIIGNQTQKTQKNEELENERGNVSLHVRFSEYNEYKTIGLTDTSMMSNDSNLPRNYMEDKAWSDRSTSPDSSDVEVLFSNIQQSKCPRSSSSAGEALNGPLQKQDEPPCDEESTDQTTDDEDYTSIRSNEESYDEENTTIRDLSVEPTKSPNLRNPESDEESENCNDSGSTIGQENDDKRTNLIDLMDVNSTIFKSELLKTRLAELEREIDIFRKENATLAIQRKRLHDEQRQMQKEFKEKNENLEKERVCNEEIMQEEKKRLSREKAALENRLRDAREKSLQNKQERQEMQILREQLDELRGDTSQKESRWQAAQARQKSQMRVLQTENARLKQELEKLRASRANNLRSRKLPTGSSNTRAIHQINKQLDSKKKISPSKDSSSDEETATSQIVYRETEIEKTTDDMGQTDNIDIDGSKTIVHNDLVQQSIKSDEDLRKKRNMYVNLLSEATEGLRGKEEIVLGKSENFLEKSMNKCQDDIINGEDKSSEDASSDSVGQRNSKNLFERGYEIATENYQNVETRIATNSGETTNARSPVGRSSENTQRESRRWSDIPISQNERVNNPTVNKQDIREVQCPDGHTEYWYPNGNVKKIYPDRNVTKMIYYNGDVRESSKDGSVKYFYASTRTWHTTFPDGLEILEFPDGQVERRMKNGTNEVSFPDGSVRLLQVDGTEKWVLPDGTVAETFPDGNKILSFPNGQREVHTKEHKRREYPDGTVKLVYPDGTQETRYSNGRVRVKDKDGNLLVDVHHR